MINFFRLLLVGILLTLSTQSVNAGDAVLARDYPYSVIFHAMALRAVSDYATVNNTLPSDLETASAAGFMSYDLPQSCKLSYVNEGDWATVSTGNMPVYAGGVVDQPISGSAAIPGDGLYHLTTTSVPDVVNGELKWIDQKMKVYNHRGARWLEEGHGWSVVEDALRYDRIVRHLAWSASEFNQFNRRMPADLEELERFVGTPRNQSAWDGVVESSWPDDVTRYPGTLFAGYDAERNWVISMNLGPEVLTITFKYSDGSWILPAGGLEY
jgi:hypothetical protein